MGRWKGGERGFPPSFRFWPAWFWQPQRESSSCPFITPVSTSRAQRCQQQLPCQLGESLTPGPGSYSPSWAYNLTAVPSVSGVQCTDRHCCTLQCDHPTDSSHHVSLGKRTTVSWTVLFLFAPPAPSPSGHHRFGLCFYEWVSFCSFVCFGFGFFRCPVRVCVRPNGIYLSVSDVVRLA